MEKPILMKLSLNLFLCKNHIFMRQPNETLEICRHLSALSENLTRSHCLWKIRNFSSELSTNLKLAHPIEDTWSLKLEIFSQAGPKLWAVPAL